MAKDEPTITFEKGRYVAQSLLGAGGLAQVFLAVDTLKNEHVAIKSLLPQHAREPLLRKRFLSDALLCTQLQHPNILPVIDSGDGEAPFVAMPWAKGGDLANVLKWRHRPLSPDHARKLGCSVAEALVAAHAEGLIHGDVKPSNILLMSRYRRSREPHFVLSDFGHARTLTTASMTGSSLAWGSPAYMAPEVFVQGRGDPRSDLFSLGVVLYEVLTLRRPWTDTAALTRLVGQPALATLDLDDFHLEQLILRLLAPDPKDRPPSALTVLDALKRQVSLAPIKRKVACMRCGVPRPFDVFVCVNCGWTDPVSSHQKTGSWNLLLLQLPDSVAAWEAFHSLLSELTGLPDVTLHLEMRDGDRPRGPQMLRERASSTSLPAILFGYLCESTAKELEARFAAAGLSVVAVKGRSSVLRHSWKAKAKYTAASLATGGIFANLLPQLVCRHFTLASSVLVASALFLGLYQHSKNKAPLFHPRRHDHLSAEGQRILGLLNEAAQVPLPASARDLVQQISVSLFRLTAAWSTQAPAAAWDALAKAVSGFLAVTSEIGRIHKVLGQDADIELARAAATLQRRIDSEPGAGEVLAPRLERLEAALEQRRRLSQKADVLIAQLCDLAGQLDFLAQSAEVQPQDLELWLLDRAKTMQRRL